MGSPPELSPFSVVLNDSLVTSVAVVDQETSAGVPSSTPPEEFTFTRKSLVQVIVYTLLFAAAAAGNVPVLLSLVGKRARKSRIKLMMMHLAIADLIVTFVMIPLEVAWRLTVHWAGGNAMCKIMQVLRAFGPYLSSMVLVCISVDRYFAVLHPRRVHDARRRSKFMLAAAWYISIACSLPQAVIFHVMEHPEVPGFNQCVTFSSFPSRVHETLYNLFCLLVLYGFPLSAIILSYGRILCEIHRQAKDSDAQDGGGNEYARSTRLRCSDMRRMQRAQYRTLRLTVVIVLAFFLCWTPYVVMVLWYQLDAASAKDVDDYLQSSLFMFAVSNSCVNPLVYGSYTGRFKLPCCQPGCFPPERVRPQPTFKDNDGRYYSSLRRISRRTLHSWIPKTVVAAVATVGAKQERAALPRDCGPLCIVEMRDMCAFTADGGCMPSPMEPRSAQVNRAAHCAALSPKKNHSL